MSDWQFHARNEENLLRRYACGLVAGQRVSLLKDLVIRNHQGEVIAVHPAGEIWQVMIGVKSDPVVWFRQADGEPHTWDDDATSVFEWFRLEDPFPE